MSFFNEKDFLDNVRGGKEEMQLKESAPLFSRPTSPEKKLTIRLEDIPEATPGRNAFAQQAARMDRHRLDSNAFYQQEVQRRMATPPAGIHPALKGRSLSDPPTPPRDSSCTTMSPFINAGQKENSPPLKLVPSATHVAEPTARGCIEERREQILHVRSKSKDERTPVFIPTPKISSSAFPKPSGRPGSRAEKEKDTTVAEPHAKTPKKSFLEKLRLTTNLRGTLSPSASTLGGTKETDVDEPVPVKAQAVLGSSPSKAKGRASLGASPSKTNIPRSPSKRKNFFFRKNSEVADINASKASLARPSADADHPPLTATTVAKTPQTAFSDPTHYSYQNTRIASQTISDRGADKGKETNKCAVARSQSLKYFDHAIPPTPPAKNTPPDEKVKGEAALTNKSSRLPFHDDQSTPSKTPTGRVSTSGRLSPTKTGGYGHRETATLITRPSVYSLHASVVPNLTEASTFEEMKARIDGLGLEGFSMPPENTRSPKVGMAYTPSIYSNDWSPRPNSAFASMNPSMLQGELHSKSPSAHTKSTSKSTSSGGEIPVCYPDLAKDPSVSDMTPMLGTAAQSKPRTGRGKGYLSAEVPWHGRTHSRDHSNSPRQSVDSTIFAHHVDDDLSDSYYDSPTSFSHPSAAPSPLQTLPSTTYEPPPRTSSKLPLPAQKPESITDHSFLEASNGLGIQTDSVRGSTSPPRRNGLFEKAPSLPPQSSPAHSRNASPEAGFRGGAFHRDVNVDPLKPSPTRSPSAEKLDRMIDMLNQLKARNNEITSMRDEMRTSNARLDERLAAVESLKHSSGAPSYASDESSTAGEVTNYRAEQNRIPTGVAHDFYRSAKGSQDSEGDGVVGADSTGSDTIAELRETNRRLLEMVGGFAEKIQALEKKVNNNALE